MQIGIMIDQRRNEKRIVNEYSARVEYGGSNSLIGSAIIVVSRAGNSYRAGSRESSNGEKREKGEINRGTKRAWAFFPRKPRLTVPAKISETVKLAGTKIPPWTRTFVSISIGIKTRRMPEGEGTFQRSSRLMVSSLLEESTLRFIAGRHCNRRCFSGSSAAGFTDDSFAVTTSFPRFINYEVCAWRRKSAARKSTPEEFEKRAKLASTNRCQI